MVIIMPIKWKDKVKPDHVINRISAKRTFHDDGRVSYAGLVVDECMPVLHSMLNFPAATAEIDIDTLVWRALNRAGRELTSSNFLIAANKELDASLAKAQVNYLVLTSLSLSAVSNTMRSIDLLDCKIKFLKGDFPSKFKKHRNKIIEDDHVDIKNTPNDYCKIIVEVSAKSPSAAFNKAIRSIDVLRALMCLMSNSEMQITFGSKSQEAINKIRLGGNHTVHLESGESAYNGYWYEPEYRPAKIYYSKNPEARSRKLRSLVNKIKKSNFLKNITSSLLLYVRGFDLTDHNVAFLKVWSALEMLTTPNIADYDKLIRRTVFLFDEKEYNQQVLGHLRNYRNSHVHAGEESENAKIHCYQLQKFYRLIVWFYIGNGDFFKNLDEIGSFLDLPYTEVELEAERKKISRAIRLIKGEGIYVSRK